MVSDEKQHEARTNEKLNIVLIKVCGEFLSLFLGPTCCCLLELPLQSLSISCVSSPQPLRFLDYLIPLS